MAGLLRPASHFLLFSCKTVIDPIELVRLDWVSVRPSRIHGFGLFAQAFIPAESYIGVYAGPPVAEDGRYVLWVEEGERVMVWIMTLPGPVKVAKKTPSPPKMPVAMPPANCTS